MSDIGLFSAADEWLLIGIAAGAIVWPLTVFGWGLWQWGRRAAFGGLVGTMVLIALAFWPLRLHDSDTAWPIILAWAAAPIIALLAVKVAVRSARSR